MIDTRDWGITIHLMSRMQNKLKEKGWKKDVTPVRNRMSFLENQQVFKKKFTANYYKPGYAIHLAEEDLRSVIDCKVGLDTYCIGMKCIGAISLDGNNDTYFEYIFKK